MSMHASTNTSINAFTYPLTVQLHHTDAYGIIFFANQFKFCHDAFQAFLDHVGLPLPPRRELVTVMLVIVHVEADYKVPVHVGDRLRLEVRVHAIGTTSLQMDYRIFNQHGAQVGGARTVHVSIDTATSGKVEVPQAYRVAFAPYVVHVS